MASMNVDCEMTELRDFRPQQEHRTGTIIFEVSNGRQQWKNWESTKIIFT